METHNLLVLRCVSTIKQGHLLCFASRIKEPVFHFLKLFEVIQFPHSLPQLSNESELLSLKRLKEIIEQLGEKKENDPPLLYSTFYCLLSCVRGHLLRTLKMNQLSVYTWAQIQREGQLLLGWGGNPAQEGVGSVGALVDKKQRSQQMEK